MATISEGDRLLARAVEREVGKATFSRVLRRIGRYRKSEPAAFVAERRTEGMLSTLRQGPGRPRKDAALYGPEALAHTACIVRALDQGASLDSACLISFARGFTPRERAIRVAYRRTFEPLLPPLDAPNPIYEGRELARKATHRAARNPMIGWMVTNLGASLSDEAGVAMVRKALRSMFAIALGAPLAPSSEVANALGIDPHGAGLDRNLTVEERAYISKPLSIGETHATIQGASFEDLLHARDVARITTPALAAFLGEAMHDLGVPTFMLGDEHVAFVAIPRHLVKMRALGREVFDGHIQTIETWCAGKGIPRHGET